MSVDKPAPRYLGLVALLCLGLFAWAPALYPGYWQALEGFVPTFNVTQNAPLASIGTAPDLWRGVGSGAFLLAQPLLWLGSTPVAAVRFAFILCFIGGGLGIYVWLRQFFDDRAAGLAGLVYMFLPPFLATIYVRGSLADANVLAALPFGLAGLAIYARQRGLAGAAIAVLAILWLWRAQAGLALFATSLLVCYALAVERSWIGTLIVAVASMAGAITLFPIWGQTGLPPVPFGEHFADLYQFFGVAWATAPSVAGWQDHFPFQLGFVAISFGLVALWGWWLTPKSQLPLGTSRLLAFCGFGVAILLLLSLAVSAPLWQVTGAERLLTYPWQLLLLAAPLLAALAGALPVVLPGLGTPAYWSALVTITVLASYSYLTPAYTQVQPPARPVAMFGTDQVAILAAELSETTEPRAAELTVTWQPLQPLDFDYNVFFQAIAGTGGEERSVAQLDAQPLAGARPATDWRPGEILTETYRLDLTAAPENEPLRYYFGYYDWRDGRRLPADGGVGDKLVLPGQANR